MFHQMILWDEQTKNKSTKIVPCEKLFDKAAKTASLVSVVILAIFLFAFE